jgi:O-acetyl-ADP-ribose deacetylase (regulator of RNase III)
MEDVIRQADLPGGPVFQLLQGDLTGQRLDAIVNAANAHLQHGGGVAGAISRRGGPAIQAESDLWVRQHGPLTHDRPAVTSGGDLPCKYVIHAVGPVYGEGGEDAKLGAAVTGALRQADQLGLASIALPAISTGIFGFPKERAAQVILSAISRYFDGTPSTSLRLVRLVLIDRPTLEAFMQAWDAQYPLVGPDESTEKPYDHFDRQS